MLIGCEEVKEDEFNAESVEIEEFTFGKKRKSGKGTSRQKWIVFGIVERSGRKCMLRLVPTNSKEELLPLIQAHMNQACHVYHDGLATYAQLRDLGSIDRRIVGVVEAADRFNARPPFLRSVGRRP